MSKITYVPINSETCEYLAQGQDFDNHADAYIASLTNGEAVLARDGDGYMRAAKDGQPIYTGGSFDKNDQAAKDEVVREIARQLNIHEYRFTTLKVQRDDEGKIVAIDGSSDVDLIAYWNKRIG